MAAVLLTSLSASAQFEKGKKYIGASLSSLNLAYNGASEFQFGLEGQVGYFFFNNVMLGANLNYTHAGKDIDDYFSIGAEGRYYIIQNGLYLGAGVDYVHSFSDFNDCQPKVEVGYAFFVSRTVTIEPAIYYRQSIKDHSNYSTIGLKVGVGIYL